MSTNKKLDLKLLNTPEEQLLVLIFNWRKELQQWRNKNSQYSSGDTMVWGEVIPLILASFGANCKNKKQLDKKVKYYHEIIKTYKESHSGLPNLHMK